MRNRILTLWEQQKISHLALLLYICLYRKAQTRRSRTVQCNARELRLFLHISHDALQHATRTLVEEKFIVFTPGDNRTASTYMLCSPTEPQRSPTAPQRSCTEPHNIDNIHHLKDKYLTRKSSVPTQDKDKFEKDDLWKI